MSLLTLATVALAVPPPEDLGTGGALSMPTPAPAPKGLQIPRPTPSVLVQSWVTVFDQDEDPTADPATWGDPEDDPGLKLRRARLGLSGRNQHLSYAVVLGQTAGYDALNPPSTDIGLVDAFVGARLIEGLWVSAGLQKLPVSREQLMSSADLVLAERAVGTSAFLPDAGRDAGITLDGTLGNDDVRGRLRLGIYNGNGSELGDIDAGKLIAARLEGSLGEDATYTTWGTVDRFTLGLAVDGWLDQDRATTTAAVGGDAILRVAGLAVLGEVRLARITPTNTDVDVPGVLAETPRFGAMAQAGYTFGRFEPAVRFSVFDDHTGIDDNGDVAEGALGMTWHSGEDHIRVGAGYVLRLETQGRSIANDTARLWLQLRI
ncbi:MAG: OprO/OprP family phosphate-selective porin [Myxococcales bacterium]|nr:OprO/OprP family phosphate-selective porin [Myxococcales bacterium]